MSEFEKLNDKYDKITEKISDNIRKLTFAGFAIVWIFADEKKKIIINDLLVLASLLLAFSIIFEIIQYLSKSYFIKREALNNNYNNNKLYTAIYAFYYLKIAMTGLGYLVIIWYLCKLWMESYCHC